MKIFFALITIFTLFAGFMVYRATSKTSSSIVSVSELYNSINHERLRVGGRVSDDPIEYTLEPKIKLKFKIVDPLASDNGKSIRVEYDELKPDMFSNGRDVLIDGDFKDGVLYANNLLTQCPSKYEPPDPKETANQTK